MPRPAGKKYTAVNVSLDHELYGALRAAAAIGGRTVSEEVRAALAMYLRPIGEPLGGALGMIIDQKNTARMDSVPEVQPAGTGFDGSCPVPAPTQTEETTNEEV